MKKIKAAFFDRDGTLIKDVSYLHSLDQIEILPNVLDLCHLLQEKAYKLFVITNQSGVARGYFSEKFVQHTHKYLKKLFAKENIFFEKFYYCPHLKDCFCRKPNVGLFLQAKDQFNIDLSQSLMFGDKSIDIQAGQAAGCKSFYIQDFFDKKGIKEWKKTIKL